MAPCPRILAACSLGGASHLNPLLPFLAAARPTRARDSRDWPAALGDMVGRTGFAFAAGGEPDEAEIAPIREQLPVVPSEEAAVLGNRDLFGRLATTAMLPAMAQLIDGWGPDLVLREPCEYASAVVAHGGGIPTAQVAISLADVEAGSIAIAAPCSKRTAPGSPASCAAVRTSRASGVGRPLVVRGHEPLPRAARRRHRVAARLVAAIR